MHKSVNYLSLGVLCHAVMQMSTTELEAVKNGVVSEKGMGLQYVPTTLLQCYRVAKCLQ